MQHESVLSPSSRRIIWPAWLSPVLPLLTAPVILTKPGEPCLVVRRYVLVTTVLISSTRTSLLVTVSWYWWLTILLMIGALGLSLHMGDSLIWLFPTVKTGPVLLSCSPHLWPEQQNPLLMTSMINDWRNYKWHVFHVLTHLARDAGRSSGNIRQQVSIFNLKS